MSYELHCTIGICHIVMCLLLQLPIPSSFPPRAQALISRCWAADPAARPSPGQAGQVYATNIVLSVSCSLTTPAFIMPCNDASQVVAELDGLIRIALSTSR